VIGYSRPPSKEEVPRVLCGLLKWPHGGHCSTFRQVFFREATNRISSGFLYEAIKAAVAVYGFNSDKKNLTVSIATGLILALLILVVSYLDL
jgi:hypothetical protein